jgi:16S rRNA (uracil1498-N3)-methyltransferase
VLDIARHGVRCEARGTVETLPASSPAITLFQCVAKGARMEWLVEKAVELGAAAIVPVLSRHAVVKLPPGARVERWDRIADSALEQSNGVWRTRVEPVQDWKAALALVRTLQPTFVAALTPSARLLREVLAPLTAQPPAAVAWFVGPEGDFAADELSSLLAAGAIPVSLGPRILRTETAALYGLCALSCAFGAP